MTTSATNKKNRLRRAFVPTSAIAELLKFTDEMMQVYLADGRILSVPLIWFPALHAASPEQREQYRIGAGGRGLHWPDLDEDLSVAGLLAGADSQSA
jgi:Protein of unknown function (DUF2442)